MKKLFNEEVVKLTQKHLSEIESELDLSYCEENNVSFPNDEIDMLTVDLISEKITDLAYEFLHPTNNETFLNQSL